MDKQQPKAATEQICDLLMEIGLLSDHVCESRFGPCPMTRVGNRIFKAIESIEQGFCKEFFPHVIAIAKVIEKESPEVQQKFNQMLVLISKGDAELVRQYRTREVESLNRRITRLVAERDLLLQSLDHPLTIQNLRIDD